MFGLKLFSLANMALSGIKLREEARPFLRSLMHETGLTVHMGIVERHEMVLVEKIGPAGMPKLATWLGKRMDLHCTGVGKAVLAHLPEEELRSLITSHGLPRHNENTIASMRRLRAELAQIRTRGYSVDDEEDEIGTRCVGAPIFDRDGRVIAAVSVAGTIDQITPENLSHCAGVVKRAADLVSQTLQSEPEDERAEQDSLAHDLSESTIIQETCSWAPVVGTISSGPPHPRGISSPVRECRS